MSVVSCCWFVFEKACVTSPARPDVVFRQAQELQFVRFDNAAADLLGYDLAVTEGARRSDDRKDVFHDGSFMGKRTKP